MTLEFHFACGLRSYIWQALREIHERATGMEQFTKPFLMDDCQFMWQDLHETLYASANEIEGAGGNSRRVVQRLREQAKDSLFLNALGDSNVASGSCSYKNYCIKTPYDSMSGCQVDDGVPIPIAAKMDVTSSKARCNALWPGIFWKEFSTHVMCVCTSEC